MQGRRLELELELPCSFSLEAGGLHESFWEWEGVTLLTAFPQCASSVV